MGGELGSLRSPPLGKKRLERPVAAGETRVNNFRFSVGLLVAPATNVAESDTVDVVIAAFLVLAARHIVCDTYFVGSHV